MDVIFFLNLDVYLHFLCVVCTCVYACLHVWVCVYVCACQRWRAGQKLSPDIFLLSLFTFFPKARSHLNPGLPDLAS